MMNEETRLLLALYQVEGITQLTKDNEYKHYLYCKLSSIKCELERQLTNLRHKSKIKEQTTEDDD
jgi:hypothetical protein